MREEESKESTCGVKAAIVTWIKYNNFGTFLQAYALQQMLSKIGIDSCILDDSKIIEEGRSVRSSNMLRSLCLSCRRTLSILYKYGVESYLKGEQSDKLYSRFKHEHLRVDAHILPLSALNDKYDIFICGSDQIWYPSPLIFSPYYYLDFAEKKKIAYAPSIGTTQYPAAFIPKVRPLLERFDSLSVREKMGADIIGSIVGRKVPAVLDPTLLLERKDWERLVLPRTLCIEDYLLCYFLTYNEAYIRYAVGYARRHSLQVVTFAIPGLKSDFADVVLAAGPQEFVTAIKQARLIFTDSFHGSIFSLQFRKVFYTFKRFADDAPNSQNSRVNNLLQLAGLKRRFIDKDGLALIETLPAIDYEAVERNLSREREKSIQYLKDSLND